MTDNVAMPGKPVVLASASRIRRELLVNAGLTVETVASGLDEATVIAALAADRDDGLPPADVASVLAEAKAQTVSAGHPSRLVIGADQTLDLDGELFVKPQSIDAARSSLLRLRGRTHLLHSAISIVRDGETLWSTTETAAMTMRAFTPQFLGRYVAAEGEAVLASVGCYRVEGPGIQLFERIDGDWTTVLGLPLLPLLGELRRLGAIET
jgi:nucleoside triphosphate pyrophosphatase